MEHLQTIEKIFCDKLLVIPSYQRAYAWEKRHTDDLLDDLDLLDTGQEHYTGTVVLKQAKDDAVHDELGGTLHLYDVVDGQQRLTTVVLLLDAIRAELATFAHRQTLADGISSTFLRVRELDGNSRTRLTLQEDVHPFFERVLEGKTGPDAPAVASERRLLGASKRFTTYLRAQRKAQGEGYETWLVELQRRIRHKLKLTVYDVPNEADVGIIFEVMNNRGKPLTEMEKVKNYLLFLAVKLESKGTRDLASSINRAWHTVFQQLMDADAAAEHEDRLLRAHWLMAYNPNSRAWNGSTSIKEQFDRRQMNDAEDAVAQLQAYVDSLRDFAVVYCDCIKPSRSSAFNTWSGDIRTSIVHWSLKLIRLDTLATFIPLLAAVRLRFGETPKTYLDMLKIAELYSFRVYRWAEKRSDAGQRALVELAHNLYRGRIGVDDLGRGMADAIEYYAPAKDFLSELEETAENWYQWSGLKYFLYEYEEFLADGKAVQVPWEMVVRLNTAESIEHILPQTASDPYWRERWNEEQRERYTHDIGNLVLTYQCDNSSYSNKPFTEKKGAPGEGRCYANSSFFQERDVAKYDEWTPAYLRERRRKIIDWAKTRWGAVATS